MVGELTTVVGVMGSGKSEKLIEMYYELKEKGINVGVFKPIIDTRTTNLVMSRNGKSIPAIAIKDINDIYTFEIDYLDVILIDEAQFFNQDDVVDALLSLTLLGIDVYVFGLDLTSEGKTFGKMGDIMAASHEVIKLTRKCNRCENDARISHYNGNDKTQDIRIGDLGEYEPLCLQCFALATMDKPFNEQSENETIYHFLIGGDSVGFKLDLYVPKSDLEKAGYAYEDVMDINSLEGAENLLIDLEMLKEGEFERWLMGEGDENE